MVNKPKAHGRFFLYICFVVFLMWVVVVGREARQGKARGGFSHKNIGFGFACSLRVKDEIE